jgi:hypothetical protein
VKETVMQQIKGSKEESLKEKAMKQLQNNFDQISTGSMTAEDRAKITESFLADKKQLESATDTDLKSVVEYYIDKLEQTPPSSQNVLNANVKALINILPGEEMLALTYDAYLNKTLTEKLIPRDGGTAAAALYVYSALPKLVNTIRSSAISPELKQAVEKRARVAALLKRAEEEARPISEQAAVPLETQPEEAPTPVGSEKIEAEPAIPEAQQSQEQPETPPAQSEVPLNPETEAPAKPVEVKVEVEQKPIAPPSQPLGNPTPLKKTTVNKPALPMRTPPPPPMPKTPPPMPKTPVPPPPRSTVAPPTGQEAPIPVALQPQQVLKVSGGPTKAPPPRPEQHQELTLFKVQQKRQHDIREAEKAQLEHSKKEAPKSASGKDPAPPNPDDAHPHLK